MCCAIPTFVSVATKYWQGSSAHAGIPPLSSPPRSNAAARHVAQPSHAAHYAVHRACNIHAAYHAARRATYHAAHRASGRQHSANIACSMSCRIGPGSPRTVRNFRYCGRIFCKECSNMQATAKLVRIERSPPSPGPVVGGPLPRPRLTNTDKTLCRDGVITNVLRLES